jgi:putative thioredoxin
MDLSETTPATPDVVIDVTAGTFERDVLLRSREVPVLLDFWATWCGPCRTLGPLLERVAHAENGRFVLAKIDTEAEQELAAAFQIQSIPTVLLFVDGRPVDGFMGALPEEQIRAFLEPHLGPGGAEGSAAADGSAALLERVRALEQGGNRGGAIVHLLEALRGAPAGPEAGSLRVELARLLLDEGRADEVDDVVAALSDEDWAGEAGARLAARLELVRAQAAGPGLEVLAAAVEAAPDDVDARLALGRALVAAGRHEDGLEELLAGARKDLKHDGGAPRKALLEFFELLGPEDALTLEYQRRLSHLLCL